jgi:hypothetical protein
MSLDSRIDKCAGCCAVFTKLPASSHFLSSLLLIVPLSLSISTITFSSGLQAVFPSTYTSWRLGLSSCSLICCFLAWFALHKLAPGSLRLLGWAFGVMGHYFFVMATVDAQFAKEFCNGRHWSDPLCSTSTGYSAAAASLATAPALDAACLVSWMFVGGVLQQRAARLTHEAEQAAAAAALAESAHAGAGNGPKKITIQVS